MTMLPMQPSARRRLSDAKARAGRDGYARDDAVRDAIIAAYHDGFRAALTLMAEPSGELLDTAAHAYEDMWNGVIDDIDRGDMRRVLRAAAAKLGEGEG